MSRAFVDRARLQAMLLAGEKVEVVAATLGCAGGTVSNISRDMGLELAWVTPAEREALAALRSGRALVVHAEAAPACARLVEQIDSALRDYRSSISARRQNHGTTAPAVAASREAAGECLRADTLPAVSETSSAS